ncbi:MAG: type 2 isopentenyl-diphosphate Delta-isomerase [Candidatus Micrarchaeota archaeon]
MAEAIQSRKKEHVEAVLTGGVEAERKTTGFEKVEFEHCCLPELDWKDIDTTTTFLGRKFDAPFIVTGMTGGYPEAERINNDLAAACQAEGVAFGLGSMRAMVENPALARTFDVRQKAPKVFLIGNIGGAQLKKMELAKLRGALDALKADALAVHLNPCHEAAQQGGDLAWKGVLDAVRRTVKECGRPVIAKEVGNGVSAAVAKKLESAGVAAIDVAGAGGTSWVAVELARGGKREADVFWDWGIPTATAVKEVSKAIKIPVVASGGVRSGLDAAKAIRLGATLAGAAAPFIKAQRNGGGEGVRAEIRAWKEQLKIAMLCTGSRSLAELRKARLVE